jgi:hypothetical protein
LSKSILDRYNIKDKVELKLEKGQIILKPVEHPRKGWDKALMLDKFFLSRIGQRGFSANL